MSADKSRKSRKRQPSRAWQAVRMRRSIELQRTIYNPKHVPACKTIVKPRSAHVQARAASDAAMSSQSAPSAFSKRSVTENAQLTQLRGETSKASVAEPVGATDAAVSSQSAPSAFSKRSVTASPAATHVCDKSGVCMLVCVRKEIHINAVCASAQSTLRVGQIPRLQVHLGNVPTVASKDTGAGLSCMNSAHLESLEKQGVPITHVPIKRRVRGANNSLLVCKGTVSVPMRVGNLQIQHEFLVIKDLCYNVLLGQDFWERYQTCDHSAKKYFELCDGSYMPYFNVRAGTTDLSGAVATVRPVRLPPMSAQIVWCKVRHHIRRDTDGVFEPDDRRCAKGVFIRGI